MTHPCDGCHAKGTVDNSCNAVEQVAPEDMDRCRVGVNGLEFVEKKECYECGKMAHWLAPDSRCGRCTGFTPEEIKGDE